MIRIFSLLNLFVFLLQASLPTTGYNWPCVPFDQQHWINGTFCENREGNSGPIDHFHDGVDIHLSQGGQVYSVINGTVTSIGWPGQYGINSWVRVGRYAYVHVNPAADLSVGDPITAYETILGATNEWNHIHFKDGYPGSEINSLREEGGLTPFEDPFNPEVVNTKFYLDGTTSQFLNNKVYGIIDVVSRAADVTDTGPIGGNNGIYKIGFDIINENDEVVFGPRMPFQFDEIPTSDSYAHNVFHEGSTTSIYRYIVSNFITHNGNVDVTNWTPGFYRTRVFTWDTKSNADTLITEFEVTEQDTIAPPPPTLLSVMHEENGIKIRWLPYQVDDLTGYRLYFSFDLENWTSNHDETVLTNTDTVMVIPSFPEDLTIYFKLTAIDNAPFPNESEPSDIYGIRLGLHGPEFLIIDGFNRIDGVWNHPSHFFVALLGERIGNTNWSFDTIADKYVEIDTTFTMNEYEAVIFYSLDDIDPYSNNLIQQLYERGPSGTWLIGSRLLEIFAADSLGQLYLELLELSLGQVFPLPDQLSGFWNYTFQLSNEWYTLDSLNSVVAEPTVSPLLENGNGTWFGAQAFMFLYTAPPPELLFGSDPYPELMEMIAEYLLFDLPARETLLIPKKFKLNVYPNPFNSNTTLSFAIPTPGILEISLYSILGQQIWQEDVPVFSGSTVIKPLPEILLNDLSSGIYIVKADLQSDIEPLVRTESRKIVLIK